MKKSALSKLGQNDAFRAIQDGRNYIVVAREGNMTELFEPATNRFWAWPNSATVLPMLNARR